MTTGLFFDGGRLSLGFRVTIIARRGCTGLHANCYAAESVGGFCEQRGTGAVTGRYVFHDIIHAGRVCGARVGRLENRAGLS